MLPAPCPCRANASKRRRVAPCSSGPDTGREEEGTGTGAGAGPEEEEEAGGMASDVLRLAGAGASDALLLGACEGGADICIVSPLCSTADAPEAHAALPSIVP